MGKGSLGAALLQSHLRASGLPPPWTGRSVYQGSRQACSFLQLYLLKLQPRLGKYILHTPHHKQVPDCWRHHVSPSFLCLSTLFTAEFSRVQIGSPLSISLLSKRKGLSPAPKRKVERVTHGAPAPGGRTVLLP